MSIFQKVVKKDDVEQVTDNLGGFILEADAYELTIEAAYADVSKGGANFVSLHTTTPDGKRYREDLYFTSGTDKGGAYTYERNGKTFYLPGYIQVDHLVTLVNGHDISAIETERKYINKYNPELGREVPTEVDMIVGLQGKKVGATILKNLEDKTIAGDDGKRVKTGETRETNAIDRFYDADTGLTVVESVDGIEEATYVPAWVIKNKGKVRDKTDKKGGSGAKSGAPGGKQRASLFKKPS